VYVKNVIHDVPTNTLFQEIRIVINLEIQGTENAVDKRRFVDRDGRISLKRAAAKAIIPPLRPADARVSERTLFPVPLPANATCEIPPVYSHELVAAATLFGRRLFINFDRNLDERERKI